MSKYVYLLNSTDTVPSIWERQNVLVPWFSNLFKSKPPFQMKYYVKLQSSVQLVQYTKASLKSILGLSFLTLCLPGGICLGWGKRGLCLNFTGVRRSQRSWEREKEVCNFCTGPTFNSCSRLSFKYCRSKE